MSTAQIEYLAFLATMGLLTVALTVGLDRVFRRRPQGPDVGLAVFVEDPTEPDEEPVDEDIRDPKLERIDLALARTTDPAGRDWLLDKRIDAMRRAG